MSGTTPRTGIKTWDGSDPFLRADFNDNWRKVDSYLSAFICTSTTRPSWGAAQAGMRIFETDTRRDLMWTGTTWKEPLPAPPGYSAFLAPHAQLYQGTTVSYNMATFTLNRPATVSLWLGVGLAASPWSVIGGYVTPLIDGADASIPGDTGSIHVWSPSANQLTAYRNYACVPAFGVAQLNAGSHTFGMKVQGTPYGNNGSGGIELFHARALAVVTNNADV